MPDESVTLRIAGTRLNGDFAVSDEEAAPVLFAHGSGSSRHSPRNQAVVDLSGSRSI